MTGRAVHVVFLEVDPHGDTDNYFAMVHLRSILTLFSFLKWQIKGSQCG